MAEIWNFVVTIKVALDKDMWTCGVHRFGWLALFLFKKKRTCGFEHIPIGCSNCHFPDCLCLVVSQFTKYSAKH